MPASSSKASSSLPGRRHSSNPDFSRSDLSSPVSSGLVTSFRSPPTDSALSSGIKTAHQIQQELKDRQEAGPSTSVAKRADEKYFVLRLDDTPFKKFKRELFLRESISDESIGIVARLDRDKKYKGTNSKTSRTAKQNRKGRPVSKTFAILKILRSPVQKFLFYTVPASTVSANTSPCLSYYCEHRELITIRYHKETQTANEFFVKSTVIKSVQTDRLTSRDLQDLLQRALRFEDSHTETEPSKRQGGSHKTHGLKNILHTAHSKSHEETTKSVTFLNDYEKPPSPAPYDSALESLRRPINIIKDPQDYTSRSSHRSSRAEARSHSTRHEIDPPRPSASKSRVNIYTNPLDIYLSDFEFVSFESRRYYQTKREPPIYYVPNKYIPRFPPPPHNNKLFWNRHHKDTKSYVELDSPIDSETEEFEEVSPNDDYRYCYFVGPYRFPRAQTLPAVRHPLDNTAPRDSDYEYRSPPDSPSRNPERPMGRMGSLEDHERKVIIEFCHLLEKSKQLFNGLRELPQYGHKQWHSYFGRTFDVYTKLWKFQQQHRSVLDSKYGLKRWQIGEIASKIGQLYYHFYLRTSETAYLNEAYSFYYAIRGRSYYTKASKEDKCELMVKKLRYYARFIVACLLLKKVKLVRELIKELDRQIIEYGNTYDPDDQIEWTVVVDEVKAFIQSEPVVTVIHPDNYPMVLSHRLSAINTPPVERLPQMNLTLQEVIIVGSSSHQVKFSELTLDMFRMLQTLEREPTGEIQHMYDDSPRQRFNLTPSAINNKGYNLETGPRCENPHKYLLFKPAPSQILVYLASACNDLPPNGALLLYMSADGQIAQPSKHPEDVGYDIGGLITTSKNEVYRESSKDPKGPLKKEQQVFHPGDVYPFTRRPLFIIIESDNSYVFQNIPRHFGQPMVILMSPLETPTNLHASSSDRRHQGSLFTLFLHSPLTAFCHCCDIHNISLTLWDRAQSYVDTFLVEASQIVCRRIDPMYLSFMGDDFLRLLILRYIFCEICLRMHRGFRSRSQLTRCSPPIADDLLEHPALTHIIMDLAAHLQVRANFHDPTAAGPPPAKE